MCKQVSKYVHVHFYICGHQGTHGTHIEFEETLSASSHNPSYLRQNTSR